MRVTESRIIAEIYHVRPVNKPLCLEQLCASNYRKLFTLIPKLLTFKRCAVGHSLTKPNLHLRIIERAPYTITMELSHQFNCKLSNFSEPAVKIRLYLDARLVDVLSDHERTPVNIAITDPVFSKEIMDYKWSLNYFFAKWLDHCLRDDYQFVIEPDVVATDYLSLEA